MKRMLGTRVIGIEYDFCDHHGRVLMERGCNVDMAECINYFRRIDPDVEYIRTIADIEEDTSYRRGSDGRWEAIHKGRRFGAYDIPADHEWALRGDRSTWACGPAALHPEH